MTDWPSDWPSLNALQQMARDVIRCEEAAEHALSHTIAKALSSPPPHNKNIRGWFRTTIRNAAIDWLRRPRHTESGRTDNDHPAQLLDRRGLEEIDRAELRETVEILNGEIERLDELVV